MKEDRLAGLVSICPKSRLDEFWRRGKRDDNGCLIWQSTMHNAGYGTFSINQKPILAHRLSKFLTDGSLDPDICVCHVCDVRACFEPTHLFLGTRADNLKDMAAKGRSALGMKNARSKLTNGAVLAIRREHEAGVTSAELASQFDVSTATVTRVVSRAIWAHIAEVA